MSDRDYCYPLEYTVLRNRLDIRDAAVLEAAKRELAALRPLEPVPVGDFELDHLTAVHRHLFQDVYARVGEVRTVKIAKGKSRFQPQRFIAAGMADIHHRIGATGYHRGSGPDGFAEGECLVLGTANHADLFRETNDRMQVQSLKQPAACAVTSDLAD